MKVPALLKEILRSTNPLALCDEVLGVLRNWIARNPIFPSSERRF